MRALIASLALTLVGITAEAAVPTSFTVQGVLRNSGGQLQSVALNVTVGFYAAQTGGTALATYPNNMVAAQNGLFTVTVNDPQLMTKVGGQAALFVELTLVGVGTYPRQPVTSQMFALQAGQADALSSACVGCVSDGMVASGISGSKISGAVGSATSATTAASATSFTGVLTGDVTGTQGATKVSRLAGLAVPAGPCAAGYVLKVSGGAWTCLPDATSSGVTNVTASYPLQSSGGATPNISLITSCTNNQVLRFGGFGWLCANEVDVLPGTGLSRAGTFPQYTMAVAADGVGMRELAVPSGSYTNTGSMPAASGTTYIWGPLFTPPANGNCLVVAHGSASAGVTGAGPSNPSLGLYATIGTTSSFHIGGSFSALAGAGDDSNVTVSKVIAVTGGTQARFGCSFSISNNTDTAWRSKSVACSLSWLCF